MRLIILYGSIILSCLIITTVQADRKWKYTDDTFGSQNRRNAANGEQKRNKNQAVKEFDNDFEEQFEQAGKYYQTKKSKGRIDDDSSEEDISTKSKSKSGGEQQASKKIIGRIEHGKVKVLRRKEDAPQYNDDEGEEDYKQKVCRKSKGSKKVDCNGNEEDLEENENKSSKKIKYSIKFQHEKQKKKETNGDISILRLHKNGRKGYGHDKDDDSSEEDDKPLKRFRFIDDDD